MSTVRSDRRASVKARVSVEDLDVDALVTLKWIDNEVRWEGVDWINLAQDNDKRQAVLNKVLKFRVLYIAGNF
jgi:hypothetical protein